MDIYLGAALWGRKTDAKQHETRDGRLTHLQQALQTANNLANQHLGGKKTPAKFHTVFVAPEYLFAKHVQGFGLTNGFHQPNPTGYTNVTETRFMSDQNKDQVLQRLMALSLSFDRMLMVPGTVAWRKPITRAVPKVGALGRDAKALQRLTEATKRNATAFNMQGSPLSDVWDEPVAGDMEDNSNNVIHAAATNRQKLLALPTASHIGRNTAYVLLNGEIIHKYHKQGDYHEVLDNTGNTVFIPGVVDGAFTIDDVRFGMEICLDHGIGYLSQCYDGKEPHIHIIASASVTLENENVLVKEGGFVLHADSDQNDTQVRRRRKRLILKGKMSQNDEDPVATVNVDGDPLKFYVLHLKT